MISHDLSSNIAIKAGGDESVAQALTNHGKAGHGIAKKAHSDIEASESNPCECSYCGRVQTNGYMLIETPSPKFNDHLSLKNDKNQLCGNCYVLTHSASKYLMPNKVAVATEDGFYGLAKDAEAYFFWHNPPKQPFVAVRYTAKQAHVYWRSKPSFSDQCFYYTFDKHDYLIVRKNVMAVVDNVTSLRAKTFAFLLAAAEIHSINAMGITAERLKLIAKNEGSVLAGNYKHVRELKDKEMGQISGWVQQSLEAIATLDGDLKEKAIHLLDQLRDMSSYVCSLNNGEIWWVYLLNKMQTLELQGKLSVEIDGVNYESMKITF